MVDNNSTDNSYQIAERWTKMDCRFHLYAEKRQGVVYASNTGSERARGKYLTRMDADDIAYSSRLELQHHFLDHNPEVDVVSGLVEYISHRDNTDGFNRYVDWINSIQTYELILKRQFVESPVVNPSAMWRKETALKYGMYRLGDFPEDYELWLRWLANGVRIEKIPEYVLQWCDSDQRLTRTNPVYRDKAFFMIKSKYLAHWLKNNNPFHPRITVWGASRISRRRARLLEEYGIKISSYIDTRKNRQIDKKIIYYEHVPPPGEVFILVYIRQPEAQLKIREFLHKWGYQEGINYLMAS